MPVKRFAAIVLALPLLTACLGGPSPTGLSARDFVAQLRALQRPWIDACGYIFTSDVKPSNAVEWTSSEQVGIDPQADAVLRGSVVGLETGTEESSRPFDGKAARPEGPLDVVLFDWFACDHQRFRSNRLAVDLEGEWWPCATA